MVNWAYVAQDVTRLPILNLKCPEDCKKACYNHQGSTVDIEMLLDQHLCGVEESGRYSCVAYNFKFNLPVSECWLKDAPLVRTPKLGTASGLSGRSGFDMGDAPTDYLERRDEYRKLIADGVKCIDPSLISI